MVVSNRLIILALCFTLFTDQTSKLILSSFLEINQSLSLIDGFLSLTLRHNLGIGWSLGADLSETTRRVLFPFLGLVVGVGLLALYRRAGREQRTFRFGIALILGGGAGNVIDRVRLGYVIDFIDIRVATSNLAMQGTLNLADLWLMAGAFLCVVFLLKAKERQKNTMGNGGSP